MNNFLKIALWNANGLTQHSQEVKSFIVSCDIDIMLITKTHFTNKSYLKMTNYFIYSTRHPDRTAHGGIARIIKAKIKHEVNDLGKDYLQATNITIEDSYCSLTISAVY